jgi:hypothetical protein
MLVEQRYQAVLEVLNGATVVEVARRYGVVRQTSGYWKVMDGIDRYVTRSRQPGFSGYRRRRWPAFNRSVLRLFSAHRCCGKFRPNVARLRG